MLTRNLPPLRGGMERLNQQMFWALSAAWSTALVGPKGSVAKCGASPEWSCEASVAPLFRFLVESTMKAIRLAIRFSPEIVVAGSGLMAPAAWLACRFSRARMVVYLHGLDITAPSKIYRTFWLPMIRQADMVFANSQNTARLAQAQGVSVERIRILHPGVDVPQLEIEARADFRRRLGITGPLLLSVGRLTPRKGLAEFVRYAFPRVLQHLPDCRLLIIGEDATQALHQSVASEKQRIVDAANATGLIDHLIFMPHCDELVLGHAYVSADVYVFPVREVPGDVEGFGMVALEAAAHGLRTVAFSVGGVPDAVADGMTGALVKAGDYNAFSDALCCELRAARSEARIEACRSFALEKAWPTFGDKLRAAIASLGGNAA